jgi:hypothetical protein
MQHCPLHRSQPNTALSECCKDLQLGFNCNVGEIPLDALSIFSIPFLVSFA